MMIMADVPRRKASLLLRCNEKTLASIFSYCVNQEVEAIDLSDITNLVIDETSRKCGHDYVTITIDAIKKRIFDVQDGLKKEVVTAMWKKARTSRWESFRHNSHYQRHVHELPARCQRKLNRCGIDN